MLTQYSRISYFAQAKELGTNIVRGDDTTTNHGHISYKKIGSYFPLFPSAYEQNRPLLGYYNGGRIFWRELDFASISAYLRPTY